MPKQNTVEIKAIITTTAIITINAIAKLLMGFFELFLTGSLLTTLTVALVGVPHFGQNFASSSSSVPHFEQKGNQNPLLCLDSFFWYKRTSYKDFNS